MLPKKELKCIVKTSSQQLILYQLVSGLLYPINSEGKLTLSFFVE